MTAPCRVDPDELARLTAAGWSVSRHPDGTFETVHNGEVLGDGYPTAEAAWEEIRQDQRPDEPCEHCRGGGCPYCDDEPQVWVRAR